MPHNRRNWPPRIKPVEREYKSMRLASDRLLNEAGHDPTIPGDDLVLRDIANASRRLEGTYIIRLFAEFETGLRLFWMTIKDTEQPTQGLLNGIAAGRGILDDRLTGAHDVRVYRNSPVHERDEEVAPISISGARSHLCRFFDFLPETW
jgi:hypothetical protein